MAAALPMTKKELKDIVQCVWCGKHEDLIRFECFHISCRECLKKNIDDIRPGAEFPCPMCCAVCVVPEDGLDGFLDEPLQYRLQEMEELKSVELPSCEASDCLCGGEYVQSSHFCFTCRHHLCEICAVAHEEYKEHAFVMITEDPPEEYLCYRLKAKVEMCKTHEKPLEKFCQECHITICPECILKDHEGHDLVPIDEAIKVRGEKIAGKIEAVNERKKETEENLKELTEQLQELSNTHNKEVAEVENWGNDMKYLIDKFVQENIQRIENEARIPTINGG